MSDSVEKQEPKSIVEAGSMAVRKQHRVARFRGRPMILQREPYDHFVPLHRDAFAEIAYPMLGGVTRSRMSDIFAFLSSTAEDLTEYDRYILFGAGTKDRALWDTVSLRWVEDVDPESAIWRSPYSPATLAVEGPAERPVPFVMSLAGGDAGMYDDIMQSLAPLIMEQKPDGVIWWVGDGANGKSTLMDAIYKVFPGQLSSITVKRLTDGRDTPSLNGTLANVVKESSEGRIDDTEIYKAIGTHENFRVHKFHSQDDIEIRGNIHHIFSANTIPTFNDKGWSARRRTFVVPFLETFTSDPTFVARTFTTEMFGELVAEMARYAVRLRAQGLKYKWSAATLGAKEEYDTDANNAEDYARHIIAEGIVAFDSFGPVKMDYENFCADHGYAPLGVNNLRRAVQKAGFERISFQHEDGKVGKHYRLRSVKAADLVPFSVGRPGMYTAPGFRPDAVEIEEPTRVVPVASKPEPKQVILDGQW